MSKHSGPWEVRSPGARTVRFPSRARAQGVARQVRGAKVRRAGGWGCGVIVVASLALPLVLSVLLLAVKVG